jgi:hypothetical protein
VLQSLFNISCYFLCEWISIFERYYAYFCGCVSYLNLYFKLIFIIYGMLLALPICFKMYEVRFKYSLKTFNKN